MVVDTGHGDATERDFSPLPTRPDLVDVNCHRVIVATDWGDSGSVHRANYRRKHVESECAIDYLFPDSPDGTHLHCSAIPSESVVLLVTRTINPILDNKLQVGDIVLGRNLISGQIYTLKEWYKK